MAAISKLNRIDIRVSDEDKKILEVAAKANHLSLSAFVLSVALKEANVSLKKCEKMILSNEDFKFVLNLLEKSKEPNEGLEYLFDGNYKFKRNENK